MIEYMLSVVIAVAGIVAMERAEDRSVAVRVGIVVAAAGAWSLMMLLLSGVPK